MCVCVEWSSQSGIRMVSVQHPSSLVIRRRFPRETNHGGNLFKERVIWSGQPHLFTNSIYRLEGEEGAGAETHLCAGTGVWRGSAACRTPSCRWDRGRAARGASTGPGRFRAPHPPSPGLKHKQTSVSHRSHPPRPEIIFTSASEAGSYFIQI